MSRTRDEDALRASCKSVMPSPDSSRKNVCVEKAGPGVATERALDCERAVKRAFFVGDGPSDDPVEKGVGDGVIKGCLLVEAE